MTTDMPFPSHTPDVNANLTEVYKRLTAACNEAGRARDEITLIAVTKTVPPEIIRQGLEAGLRVFGENRVQETKAKWPELRKDYPDCAVHLIGPLQTNKAKEALMLFDVIETVDREKLAAALAREIEKGAPSRPVYVQVNIGEEPQKAGICPREAVGFAALCRQQYHLNVIGMMCIPPVSEPPAPYFALLTKLAREAGLPRISMGMSGDYDIAAQLGATHIRVGSALFGQRT